MNKPIIRIYWLPNMDAMVMPMNEKAVIWLWMNTKPK